MPHSLTVQDLIAEEGPLYPAEVVAGGSGLKNVVSWPASLRPFAPAFPRLKGGELALVATENLAPLDPPTTLADVVRQLVSRRASAMAVRGGIDGAAMSAAEEAGLPLLQLADDAPLADIEQAVMRECALHEARSEIVPQEAPGSWFGKLIAAPVGVSIEQALAQAEREGYRAEEDYAVALIVAAEAAETESGLRGPAGATLDAISKDLREAKMSNYKPLVTANMNEGLAVLLDGGNTRAVTAAVAGQGKLVGVGVGRKRSLHELGASYGESQLAALASVRVYGGDIRHFSELGALRPLLLLVRDNPGEIESFIEGTIGQLLRHDEHAANPLLPSLRAFLESGSRLRETAAGLYVHRNTLSYRLERAQEILGLDLRNPDSRLAVELALRALPLVRHKP